METRQSTAVSEGQGSGLLLGGQRIEDDRNKRRQTDGFGSIGSEPDGGARRKTGSGFECNANKMRNAFFHGPHQCPIQADKFRPGVWL